MITPKCKHGQVLPYVTADGYYLPCCWIGNLPHLTRLKEFLGDDYESMSITKHTLDEIEQSVAWQKIEASWVSEQPFEGCSRYCAGRFANTSENSTSISVQY